MTHDHEQFYFADKYIGKEMAKVNQGKWYKLRHGESGL